MSGSATPSGAPAAPTPAEAAAFRDFVYAKAAECARDLPWRHRSADPAERAWFVLLSEVMLQQTQVSRVIPKYIEWTARFPDPSSLAEAPLPEVLERWSGLGYNRRALALHRAAAAIAEFHSGAVPGTEEALRALPGVGSYTSRAVLAFAFRLPTAFLETNIRAVLAKHFFPGRERLADRELEPVAAAVVDAADPARWYDALMDYGAELKRSGENHSRRSAAYRPQAPFADSRRRVRGAVLRAVLENGRISADALWASLPFSRERVDEAALMLEAEGFMVREGGAANSGGLWWMASPGSGSDASRKA